MINLHLWRSFVGFEFLFIATSQLHIDVITFPPRREVTPVFLCKSRLKKDALTILREGGIKILDLISTICSC